MAVFDNNETKRLLDASFGVATYTFVTGSPQLRLCTAVGNDSTAGTLVTGGSYAHQSMPMSAAVAGTRQISNSGVVSFTGMPVATVTATEIYANDATTRKAYGPLTTTRTTASGDTVSFAINAVVCIYS